MNQRLRISNNNQLLKIKGEVNLENKILAICDDENTYAELLTKQLLRQKECSLEIRKFSDFEKLKEFAADKLITYLIISDIYIDKAVEIEALSYYFLTNSKDKKKGDYIDSEYIYRYQAVSDIYAQIVGCKRVKHEERKGDSRSSEPEIIGMYNPVRRNGQTTLARALALGLGKKKYKVLYINLDEIGVPVDKLRDSEKNVEGKGNISDIIYYLKQNSQQLLELINRATHQGKNFDFIAPQPIFTELQSVTLEEWILLVDFLKKGEYEKIILDLDSKIQGFTEILDRCDKVLVPQIKGNEDDEKVNCFNRGLRVLGKNKLLIKMEVITVPRYDDNIELQLAAFLEDEKLLN